MEWFLLIALMWGGFKALDKGASMAARSAKDAARRYTSAKPAKPNNAGAKAGRAVAAGWFAGVEAARGFGAGWRAGWPEGRQQAYDWRDRRRAAKADSQPDSQPDSDPDSGGWTPAKQDRLDELNRRIDEERAKQGLPPEERDDTGRPVSDESWQDELARRRAEIAAQIEARQRDEDRAYRADNLAHFKEVQDPKEDEDMSEPNSGNGGSPRSGEVTNYPQLQDALKRIEQDATDDLEDARADEARAQQDKAEIDGMTASLSRLKLDQGTISAVQEIAQAAQARADAARNRADAAEQRVATAQNAYETVKRNYEQYYEAATAAPAVPEREFAATG